MQKAYLLISKVFTATHKRLFFSQLFKFDIIRLSLILFLILQAINSRAQFETTTKHASMLVKTIQKHHIQPRAVDKEFSELVFNQFTEFLDPYELYFSNSDMQQLEAFKYSLGDIILNQNSSFLKLSNDLYTEKLAYTDSLLKSFSNTQFTYNEDDSLLVSETKQYYVQDKLGDRWRQLIKLRVLSSFYDKSGIADSLVIPNIEDLEELKELVIQREQCRLKSKVDYKGGLENYISSYYLKSIATAFDPHTSYFSKSEEAVFTNLLSKEVNSFGIEYTRNDYGEIEVAQVIPGSPAWKSNVINNGDVILKTVSSGSEKEFFCVALSEVIQYFTDEKLKKVEFFIRKKNGKTLSTTLVKEKVDVQDNIIQSFVLKGEQKIGYIYLPTFYTQIEADNYYSNGCANDVATELIKLKRENIEALIIDLRDNGGGSMMEAILMAGIFVDYGAVGILQAQHDAPSTLKDMNRGTIYNGPIAILINKFSASASEFFAAAMQDQNRAVIVGSNSYGKSTFQQVLPIDAFNFDIIGEQTKEAQAYVKLTRGGFYRVTGESHQKIGVEPDITLPTIYDYATVGESAYKTAIGLNKIEKKTYYYPLSPLPILALQEASKKRLLGDSVFAEIREISKAISVDSETYSIPLSFDSYYFYRKSYQEFREPVRHHNTFETKNPIYLQGVSSLLNPEMAINTSVMEYISTDAYIEETYNVLNDLIKLNN